MATGSFGGQLQSAISGRLTADPYEKRRKSAMGDYQAQAEKSRKDLSERLNRLGVLRGGGATASQFGEFESGVLRGQQALGAQFEAQREAGVGQAIQQGLGLYGTDRQYGLAGRQQTEAERMGQFSRELGSREFQSQDAIRRDQQRESERSALAQEGMQQGALTGMYGGKRTLDQQRQDLSYRTGLAQTFGRDIAGDEGATEAARAQGVQEGFQEAGITGTFGGAATLQRGLAEAELTGRYGTEGTLASQELALQRGQALGTIGGEDTLARDALQQDATQASMERGLRRTEGLAERNLRSSQAGLDRTTRVSEAGLDRTAAENLQAARITGTSQLQQDQFGEAALERTSRESQAGLQRDLARQELMGYAEVDGRREQTLGAREAGAQRRLTESEGAAERASRASLQQAQFGQETSQADLQRGLAREELYGGVTSAEDRARGARTLARTGQEADIAAEDRRLDEMETAGISQRGLAERELTTRTAQAAQQRALEREQLYGRAMTRAEEMGGGYLGDTLGARELTQRGDLAGADIASRERMAQEQRLLGREELYGTGDVSAQRGSTLAARQSRQDLALRGELGRGQLEQETRRTDLADAELMGFAEDAQGVRRLTEGSRAERARAGMEGRRLSEIERAGLAGEGLQERGLGQESRRISLSEAELYGQSQAGQTTLAAREAGAQRGLEGRRLTEMERAGAAGTEAERQRLRLASEEMYGGAGIDPRMGTLASREAAAGRGLEGRRVTEMETAGADARTQAGLRTDLAEAELYGRGADGTATFAAMEAIEGRSQAGFDRQLVRDESREARTQQTNEAALDRLETDRQRGLDRGLVRGESALDRAQTVSERVLDRGLTQSESLAARTLARDEMYGGAGWTQGSKTLAAENLALDQELGRGELAERVLAGSEGRALDQSRVDLTASDVFGAGQGGYSEQGATLRGDRDQFDRDRLVDEDKWRTIGMMQNLDEGYTPSQMEADLVRKRLGGGEQSDWDRFNQYDRTGMTEEEWAAEKAQYDAYGNRLLPGGLGPQVDPNTTGGETGDNDEDKRNWLQKMGSGIWSNEGSQRYDPRDWWSDPRLKENVLYIGDSPSGLKIYEFDYIAGLGIAGRYRGVMANEIPQNAVTRRAGEYDMVDYSKIDVEFERIGY